MDGWMIAYMIVADEIERGMYGVNDGQEEMHDGM